MENVRLKKSDQMDEECLICSNIIKGYCTGRAKGNPIPCLCLDERTNSLKERASSGKK